MLKRAPTEKATRQSKILVVDDNVDGLTPIKEMLGEFSWQVITCANGQEAVQKATEERPQLILLDPVTQASNGYQTLKYLRRNSDLKDIPVVMCTGISGDESEQAADPDDESSWVKSQALIIVKSGKGGSCNIISHRLLLTLAAIVEEQDCILV